jgi:hypothetical protein
MRKLRHWKPGFALCLWSIFIAAAGVVFPQSAAAIAFVQGSYATPQRPQPTVWVRYPGAQAAGDLNVVIVGWNSTAGIVTSVSDTRGNSYQLAVGPSQFSGMSQSIYYARNIGAAAAGANLVAVQFSQAEPYADVRILEYSGIDRTNPLDVVSASAGISNLSSTNAVATTNATDLLVGANMVQTATIAAVGGFIPRLISQPDGDIAEDRVVTGVSYYDASAPLNLGGNWVMQMAAFRAAGSPVPAVALQITAPPGGGTKLGGTVTVSVNASDTGNGVAGVQLRIDNIPCGVGTAVSPYSFSVDTTKFANGMHSLQAVAWNNADQPAFSSPVWVLFSNSNPGNPGAYGMWSDVIPLPDVSVHTALLPEGRVFMSDGFDLGNIAIDWNYGLNTIDQVNPPWNMFCNGMDQTADGRLIVVGGHQSGHVGLPNAGIFDPATESWSVLPNMNYPRWYPTLTTLPSGRLIVTSGEMNGPEDDCQIPEIYNPSTNSWSQQAKFPFNYYYPDTTVLPDGRLIIPSSTEDPIVSQVFNLNTQTWTPIGGPAVDGGCSVQYLPGKFLKTGTSNDTDSAPRASASTAYVLDTTQLSPTWRQVASMAYPRCYHSMTMLPNGNVLVTGGGPTTDAIDIANAILPAEIWSPTTETFATKAPMDAPRLYHSIGLLLPDGRVLISGGGSPAGSNQPTDQLSAQFFSPPYLFQGPKPVITSAPSQLSYGQNFTVQTPDAWRIGKVSLIRFGVVTHSFNTGQVFIPLSFSINNGWLTVTAPANASIAPPGNYMLFLVGTNDVPSFAAIVHF